MRFETAVWVYGLAAGAVGYLYLRLRSWWRVDTSSINLAKLAEELGLSFRRGRSFIPFMPLLSAFRAHSRAVGKIRGRSVGIGEIREKRLVRVKTRPGLQDLAEYRREQFFRLRVEAENPGKIDLHLSRESMAIALAKLMGKPVEDYPTGDPEFDKTVVVATSEPNRLPQVLTPEIRAKAIALFRQGGATGTLVVHPNGISYAEKGCRFKKDDLNQFRIAAELACDLAEVLEKLPNSPGKSTVPENRASTRLDGPIAQSDSDE